MTYVDHGRRHLPGGTDPIPISPSGSSEPPPFQPVPLATIWGAQLVDNDGFFSPKIDTSAPAGTTFGNTVTTNGATPRTSSLGDYITFPVTFGPKGSAWVLGMSWKLQPSGGQFTVTVASTVDTAGELEDPTALSASYFNPYTLNGAVFVDDTYQPVTAYNGFSSTFSQAIVVGGDDGAPMTGYVGADPDTLLPVMDGGAGTYRWKLEVTGKNASSSGYDVELLSAAWMRVTAITCI